jgi:hypothetical protein
MKAAACAQGRSAAPSSACRLIRDGSCMSIPSRRSGWPSKAAQAQRRALATLNPAGGLVSLAELPDALWLIEQQSGMR